MGGLIGLSSSDDPSAFGAAAFRATENQPAPDKFALMSITTVDYEDIGDNYALSQLSRGHCQEARINFGPLREGRDRDMGMMEARAAIAKTTVAPERCRQGRFT